MARIPIYNQGQGPQVRTQAGALSPRVSPAAFASVGQAYQSLGQQVSRAAEIAANFEVKRQDAEANTLLLQLEQEAMQMSTDLSRDGTIRTVDESRARTDAMRQDMLSRVDGLSISSRQKSKIRDNLNNKMTSMFVGVEREAFNRFAADSTEIANSTLDDLVTMAITDPESRGIVLENGFDIIERGRADGLNVYTPEKFLYSITMGETMALVNDDTRVIQDYETEREAIIKREGKYGEHSDAENQKFLTQIESKITYLESDYIDEQEAMFEDGVAFYTLTGENNGQAQKAIDNLDKIGEGAKAEKFRSALLATESILTFQTDNYFSDSTTYQSNLNDLTSEAIATAKDDPSKASEMLEIVNMAKKMQAERQAAIASDPAAYVISAFTKINGRAPTRMQIVRKQEQMGLQVYQIRPYTNAEFKSLKEVLDTASPTAAITELSGFLSGYNPNERRLAMGALMRDGLGAHHNIAMAFPEHPEAASVIQANGPGDAANFKALVDKSDRDSLAAAVTEQLTDFRESISGTGRSGRMKIDAGVTKAILNTAIMFRSQGFSETDAVNKATSIITGNYDFQRVGAGVVRFPNTLPNADVMARRLEAELISDDFGANFVTPAGATQAEKDVFISEIRTKGKWVTTSDDSGVLLLDSTGNVVKETVNENGTEVTRPVTRTFAELGAAVEQTAQEMRDLDQRIEDLILARQEVNRDLAGLVGDERARKKAESAMLLDEINRLKRERSRRRRLGQN